MKVYRTAPRAGSNLTFKRRMMVMLVLGLGFIATVALHAQEQEPLAQAELPEVPMEQEPRAQAEFPEVSTEQEAPAASTAPPAPPQATENLQGDDEILENYRLQLRRLFVLRQYSELIEVAERIGESYPDQDFVVYYRNESERRLAESKSGRRRLYPSLRDQPVVLLTPTPRPRPTPTPEPRQVAMDFPDDQNPRAAPDQPPRDAGGGSGDSFFSGDMRDTVSLIIGVAAAGCALIALVIFVRRKGAEAEIETIVEADSGIRGEEPLGGGPGEAWQATAPDLGPSALEPAPQAGPVPVVESPLAPGPPAEEGVIPFQGDPEKIQMPGAEKGQEETQPEPADRHEAEEMDTITMRPAPSAPDAPESPVPISEGSAPGEQTSDAPAEDTQPLEAASASETDIPQITEVPGVSATPDPESPESASPPEPLEPEPVPGEASDSDEGSAIDFVAAAAGPAPDAESTSMAEAGIESIPSPETSDTDPGLGTPLTDVDTQELSQTGGEFNQSTQTAYYGNEDGPPDPASVLGPEEPPLTSLEVPEQAEDEVQVFRADETASVRFGDRAGEDTSGATAPDPGSQTEPSQRYDESGEEDAFESARRIGMEAYAAADWDRAVEYLKRARAMRPEAADVTEHLRRAGRMRKLPG